MDISIVICTHNPEERVFRRCLDAVNRLNLLNMKTEILIVDNNSSPTLIARDYVNKFLKDTPSAKCILEKKPGLTYARMTGNNEAQAPVVIFFDDDNEPDQNYALAAHRILLEKKEVGIIGPGVVKVDFVDGSDAWLETQRPFFQEMSVEKELYSNNQMYYEKCYPYGTGLVVRKKILENYHSILSRNGEISDRTGNMLLSGGDKQIVLCG
ncbi:MAG: glycosyltransferase, partial [Ginsengibacter sp.]